LDTIKGGHKVGCDLSDCFLCRRRVLPIGIKDLFERASVLGRAKISEQLNRERWRCEQKADQYKGDVEVLLKSTRIMVPQICLYDLDANGPLHFDRPCHTFLFEGALRFLPELVFTRRIEESCSDIVNLG